MKWIEEEIEYLKENYSKKTNRELSELMNRKAGIILNKACYMGLRKNPETIKRAYKVDGQFSSKRMKINNPMNNKETIEKMKKTRKETIANKIEWKNIPLNDKKEFIIEKYNSGLTLRQVGELLGVSANTIKRRMIRWGMPRRTECKYSTFHKSDDGHIVKSSMELVCDNWLFNNRISHVYEKRLGETKFLCDFYIPEANLYIEIFGLTDDIYKERFKRKLEVYKNLGLGENLLIILPKDKIQDKLRFLLEFSETQRSIDKYENKI